VFWKLLRLQQLLDSLFDESWFSLGLTLGDTQGEHQDADIHVHQA
jgi:hypothetical protein